MTNAPNMFLETHSAPATSGCDRPLLKDRYQIVQPLSRGGFGETSIAKDIQRPGLPTCVVKRLNPVGIRNEAELAAARQRFDQEAAVLQALGDHDRIPRLLAHFEEEGEFYLVQELIVGPPLQQLLTEQPQRPMKWVLQLLDEVLEILTYVHSQGVIHRDIKPANLIFRQSDQHWVLIDFGAVKHVITATSSPDIGPRTMAISSEGYTPSEQMEGHPHPASDFYALGMVALQCLTGKPPSGFKSLLRDSGLAWLTPLAGCPALAAILEKMTHTHWEDRYQTAQVVLDDLRRVSLQELTQPEQIPTDVAQPSQAPCSEKVSPATVIRPPAPPPELPKLAFPPELLLPHGSPRHLSTPPSPPFPVGPATASADVTDEPQPNLWSKLPVKEVQGHLWQWLNARNIYRVQEAIAFMVCLGLLLGVTSTMTWWVVTTISQPRSRDVTPTQPVPTAPLVATLRGSSAIHHITFTANSATLFTADASGNVKAWAIDSQQPIQRLNSLGAITALAMAPDGNHLATGDEHANINLWDLRSGKLIHTLRDHRSSILSLAFNPTDKSLVSSSGDRQLMTWNLETPEVKHWLTQTSAPITSTDISPGGDYLIGGSTDFTLKVWNARTGHLLHNLTGHSEAIHTVAISPNGAVMASGGADRTVRVWNLYTGQLITTLSEHYGAVNAIAFSPDSQVVASGSDDGTIRIWHVYSGELMQKFSNFQGPISDLVISSNGKLLASSTAKGAVDIWQLGQKKTPQEKTP